MFTSYKCTRIFSRNVRFKNLLIPYCYFSQENNGFVKKVRNVENLKISDSFTPSEYEKGKYLLFLRNEYVCLEKSSKLVLRDFKDVESLRKYGNVITTFLDVLTESNSEVYLFAADLQLELDADIKKINIEGKFVNIRHTFFFLSKNEAQLIAHAVGLLHFYKSYKFCSFCGGSLQGNEGGFRKLCLKCNFIHYPHVSPIGITLIEDREHKEVLLVKQKAHPPGMYTCVSGYIEPGESLEKNAMREVAEEVGLSIENVEYCVSQHWAFPTSQLILGCIGTAVYKDFEIDEKELTDAKWLTAEELKNAVTRVRLVKNVNELPADQLWAPPCNAVSHSLMLRWLFKYHNFKPPK